MERWYIWLRFYDWNGKVTGYSKYPDSFEHKHSAMRKAREVWGDDPPYISWFVSKEDPFTERRFK